MAMSEENRKKASERMKAMHEKREKAPNIPEGEDIQSDVNMNELLERIRELESNQRKEILPQAQVTDRGLVGIRVKYSTSTDKYPDPTERLALEPRLARFAFGENYELKFKQEIASYEDKAGINNEEPRFHLDLIGKVFDDMGEPTDKRYVMRKLVFFEDPQAALVIARDNDIKIEEEDEEKFLNEMRYLRCRDWLMGYFFPVPATSSGSKREEVIGNRLVEVYEVSSVDSQNIPFDSIKKG